MKDIIIETIRVCHTESITLDSFTTYDNRLKLSLNLVSLEPEVFLDEEHVRNLHDVLNRYLEESQAVTTKENVEAVPQQSVEDFKRELRVELTDRINEALKYGIESAYYESNVSKGFMFATDALAKLNAYNQLVSWLNEH